MASDESKFITFKSPSPSLRLGGGCRSFVLQVPEGRPANFSVSKTVVISRLFSIPFLSLLQVIFGPALHSSRQAPHQPSCHTPHFLTTAWPGISNCLPARVSYMSATTHSALFSSLPLLRSSHLPTADRRQVCVLISSLQSPKEQCGFLFY